MISDDLIETEEMGEGLEVGEEGEEEGEEVCKGEGGEEESGIIRNEDVEIELPWKEPGEGLEGLRVEDISHENKNASSLASKNTKIS